jgi:hypothetical protein
MVSKRGGPGTHRLEKNSETVRIQMMATRAWTIRVDRYAKKLNMNRSEVIRRIVDEWLGVSQEPLEPEPRSPADR